MEIIIGIVVALVVVSLIFIRLLNRLIYVSGPNEVLVFSGRYRKKGTVTIGYRIVHGGRAVRVPLLERVDRLDLSNIPIDVVVNGAYSKGGIPLNIQGFANVKLPSEEHLLPNAIERFLGRSRQEIAMVAKETLEGNLRGVLARLTPEQVNQDKSRFAAMLVEEAEQDMNRMGMVLDNLKIQSVTDDYRYLDSIGRIQGAVVRQNATIAEARANAEASIQQSKNWGASEVAKFDADLAIAEQEKNRRLADANTKRGAMIAEAQSKVRGQLATIRAEIERERARALRVQRQLDADIVKPAQGACQAQEENARGQAAAIIERGRAEAEAFGATIEIFQKSGQVAREVLLMQQLVPMLRQIAGTDNNLQIKRMTVLPNPEQSSGTSLARQALGASEQFKAATGVDVTKALQKFSSKP
jgi:flotillin